MLVSNKNFLCSYPVRLKNDVSQRKKTVSNHFLNLHLLREAFFFFILGTMLDFCCCLSHQGAVNRCLMNLNSLPMSPFSTSGLLLFVKSWFLLFFGFGLFPLPCKRPPLKFFLMDTQKQTSCLHPTPESLSRI